MAALDPEAERQQKAATEWIAQKWTASQFCPICSSNQWNIAPVFQLPVYKPPGDLSPGGPYIPVFPVACMVCGYTLLFNALISEVVPRFGVAAEPEAIPGDGVGDAPPGSAS